MTFDEQYDTLLAKFRRIGLRRWTDGINPPMGRKESIVPLTNNIRRMQELTSEVLTYTDHRDYEKAHCALDDIEGCVHKLRRHIEQLQWIMPRVAGPAGENTS